MKKLIRFVLNHIPRKYLQLFAHDGRKKVMVKRISEAVALQLIQKVTISGGSCRRDNGNALRNYGQFQLFIHIGNALFLQLIDDLLAPEGNLTEGVSRINIGDVEAQSVELVVFDGTWLCSRSPVLSNSCFRE